MTEFAAKGTVLGIEIGAAPGTFTPVAQVRNISGPSLALEPIDVSTNDDAAKFYRDFLAGFHDPGEVTMELVWDPDNPTHNDSLEGLLRLYDEAALHNYNIIWPDATATPWIFAAFIVGYEPSAPYDDALTATITFKLVGVPTFA